MIKLKHTEQAIQTSGELHDIMGEFYGLNPLFNVESHFNLQEKQENKEQMEPTKPRKRNISASDLLFFNEEEEEEEEGNGFNSFDSSFDSDTIESSTDTDSSTDIYEDSSSGGCLESLLQENLFSRCAQKLSSIQIGEKADELLASKKTEKLFPCHMDKQKVPFWFNSEESPHLQSILDVYTSLLDPKEHLKKSRRGVPTWIACVRREVLLHLENEGFPTFKTLDTILVHQRDPTVPPGVCLPEINRVYCVTTWNIDDAVPASLNVFCTPQELAETKAKRVVDNIPPSCIFALPQGDGFELRLSSSLHEISCALSPSPVTFKQSYFSHRKYELGMFMDLSEDAQQLCSQFKNI